MPNPIPTTTLNDETVVLAKPDGSAQGFANRTQAMRAAETLRVAGVTAEVHEPRSPGRSWYVRIEASMERSAEILDTANGECRKTGE